MYTYVCIYIKLRKILKVGEKKTNQSVRESGAEKQHDNEFSGFSFHLIDPKTGAEEGCNSEMPIDTVAGEGWGGGTSKQKFTFSSQRTRKKSCLAK